MLNDSVFHETKCIAGTVVIVSETAEICATIYPRVSVVALTKRSGRIVARSGGPPWTRALEVRECGIRVAVEGRVDPHAVSTRVESGSAIGIGVR